MPPERRETAIEVIGRHGLESLGLAAEPGCVLWTDDGALAVLGAAALKVRRVWTQFALHEATRDEYLTQEQFERASAQLLGYGYRFTWSSPGITLAAAEVANWQADAWPLGAALDQLGEPGIEARTRLQIAAETIHAVWGRPLSPFSRQGFLFGLLRRMRSVRLINHLRRVLPGYFGLDVLGTDDVDTCIEVWMREAGSVLTA
jgi:hypothetical protein